MLVLGAGPLFIFWDVQFWNHSHPFTQFSYAQTKNQIFKLVVFWAGSVKKKKTKLFTCSCVDLIWNLILEHIWLRDTIPSSFAPTLSEEVMFTIDDVSLSLSEDNVVKGLDEVLFVVLEGSKHICSLVSWAIRPEYKRLQCELYSWFCCL